MTTESALERLARAAQVMTSYDDVFGTAHPIDDGTLRDVLGALGFDASTDEAAEATAIEREKRVWSDPLEPVYVLDADGGRGVTIARRATVGDDLVEWEVTNEDGAAIRGDVDLATLPMLESRVLDGVRYERRVFALDATIGPGYYGLRMRGATLDAATTIVLAPAVCYLPDAVSSSRGVWGLAIQLYGLRSERNWGIGDFTDLRAVCAIVRAAGGAAVGLNPLHDVRFGDGVPSPYSPSSRAFANWIYLDVEALPGYDESDVDRAAVAAARAAEYVDYAAVARLKRASARAAFERFSRRDDDDDRARFATFVEAGGERLARAAVFDALAVHFAGPSGETDWATWPLPFRDAASVDVAAFARDRATDVAFFAYLQWQADEQLERCAVAAGETVGLYRDLAVGSAAAGSEAWALQGTLTRALAVGAPPDVLNTRGQNWGVTPFSPSELRAAAYAPFVALLRANMRHAGALRIDHVMALARLYVIPAGAPATHGAYVAYRLDEMLGIVALESVRSRCMVVGEDLGTVPAGFRERLAEKHLLSYRLLQFETDDAGFLAPDAYPDLALVSIGTHDLPPIGAYWTANDVTVRKRLALLADAESETAERVQRGAKREAMLAAFARVFGADDERDRRFRQAASDPNDAETLAEVALAANRFLARTPGRLLMVQLEDVLGDSAQVNVPTTLDEHPNWRRRAAIRVEDLAADGRFEALAVALRAERGIG